LPPPNANADLHLGHAMYVYEDVMIRYHKMQGYETLWLPGADHAGFETQVVYDKKLEKEGRNRFEIEPQQLYQEILEFTLSNKKTMENQLKKLGASCDWSREKFTLDPKIVKIVYQTFEKLKKDGLLYKGERIVNWCVKHRTSLSDVEVKYEDREDKLWHFKYPLADDSGSITVATTRPETMLGDTGVAVNPKDKRYQNLVGKKVKLPLVGREIPIIADSAVEIEFGTGAVKVTPSHDPTDFEIGRRHQLEFIEVIGKNGRMTPAVPVAFQGLKAEEARIKVVEDLANLGLLEKEEPYKHAVGACYKCGRTIEPMVLQNQWFVKMTESPKGGGPSLRDMAVDCVKKKQVKFVPQRFEKIFFHWMNHLRDWNISRQITWGIKIPDESTTDVFDTWFSSGQWPFATLKSGRSKDFKEFYPTQVMETGWDILFFWVARMVMLGLYATGKPPFKHVYLHGLVRDKDRQKMSKSKGNVIDPLGVIDLYGADALRMALIVGNTPGSDIVISEEKIRGYRNFANKIWNVGRFIVLNANGVNLKKKPKLSGKDAKYLSDLNKLISETTKDLDNFKFYQSAERLYHYVWHAFADRIIEEKKTDLNAGTKWLLLEIYATCLQLLHPFMPFLTEEIYTNLLPAWRGKKPLIVESWPKP
ncbi:MAG: class I tRNA ligase family protein, partial [Candidatus Nealsonbacteria bacterium]|nr:class I tRNA ligase family protein [Candidatus Nealsonbacteria bacterium]